MNANAHFLLEANLIIWFITILDPLGVIYEMIRNKKSVLMKKEEVLE